MTTPALTRLESLLAARRLDGTLTRSADALGLGTMTTGIASLDGSLEGGWPRGEISEILGGPSSGRASVLMATLAAATARGELVALVDAFDRVDPVTASATGLVLSQVLWVRGPALTEAPMLTQALDGTILSWSGLAEELYGYTAEEVVGRSIRTLVPPEAEGELQQLLDALRRGESVRSFQAVRIHKDGRLLRVSLSVSPLRSPGGELIGSATEACEVH